MQCEICQRIHHGACSASYRRNGKPVCVWCADGLPCPKQSEILNAGDSARSRAAFILRQLRRPKLTDAEDQKPPWPQMVSADELHEPDSRPLHVTSGNESPIDQNLEEQNMSATEVTPVPTAKTISAHAARLCTTCHKNPLSYNNTTNICGECQKKVGRVRNSAKTSGGAKPHREVQAARERHAKQRAAANSNGNGQGAQTADGSLLLMPRLDSRVDLLLAAVPREDKAKMLSAWIAGKF